MSAKFDLKLQKDGDKVNVTLSGVIDEDIDFTKYPIEGAKQIQLNLGGIKSINSCGIREWIKWINKAKDASIVYDQCPKIIVDQINMVEGFLPSNGRVASFYVPYYSEESGNEKNILFTWGKEFTDKGLMTPAAVKDEDGSEMEMDVIEAKYFKFLKK